MIVMLMIVMLGYLRDGPTRQVLPRFPVAPHAGAQGWVHDSRRRMWMRQWWVSSCSWSVGRSWLREGNDQAPGSPALRKSSPISLAP